MEAERLCLICGRPSQDGLCLPCAEQRVRELRRVPTEAVDLLVNYKTHKTRISDASSFDEVCIVCGARDNLRGLGDLGLPCRGPRAQAQGGGVTNAYDQFCPCFRLDCRAIATALGGWTDQDGNRFPACDRHRNDLPAAPTPAADSRRLPAGNPESRMGWLEVD